MTEEEPPSPPSPFPSFLFISAMGAVSWAALLALLFLFFGQPLPPWIICLILFVWGAWLIMLLALLYHAEKIVQHLYLTLLEQAQLWEEFDKEFSEVITRQQQKSKPTKHTSTSSPKSE